MGENHISRKVTKMKASVGKTEVTTDQIEGQIDLLRITKRGHLENPTLKRTTRLPLYSACCVKTPQTVLLSSPSLSQCTPSVNSREQWHRSWDYTRQEERSGQPPDGCAQILVSPSTEGPPKRDNRERAYVHRCNDKLVTEQEHLDWLRRDPQLHCRSRSLKVGTHHRKGPQKNESCQLRGLDYRGSLQKSPLEIRGLVRRNGPFRGSYGRLRRSTWDGLPPRTQSYPNATGEMLGDYQSQPHSSTCKHQATR